MKRIVVGIDDSKGAAAALAWALRLAAETGADVEAIHSFEVPTSWVDGYAPDIERWTEQAATTAREDLDRVVDAALEGHPDYVEVLRTVVEGPAAMALLDHAKDADLLVVGSRGRGGFTGLLLGSVSQQVVHHARTPVVVVPSPG